jgi:hypothetical protein
MNHCTEQFSLLVETLESASSKLLEDNDTIIEVVLYGLSTDAGSFLHPDSLSYLVDCGLINIETMRLCSELGTWINEIIDVSEDVNFIKNNPKWQAIRNMADYILSNKINS